MKNLVKIISLILCLAVLALAAVACGGDQTDDFEDPIISDSDDDNTEFVTGPADSSDDGQIGEAPENDEKGWGPIIPRAN